jgi:hypothetical protein
MKPFNIDSAIAENEAELARIRTALTNPKLAEAIRNAMGCQALFIAQDLKRLRKMRR